MLAQAPISPSTLSLLKALSMDAALAVHTQWPDLDFILPLPVAALAVALGHCCIIGCRRQLRAPVAGPPPVQPLASPGRPPQQVRRLPLGPRQRACAAVADRIQERKQLRRVWEAWLLVHAGAMRDALEAEVDRLTRRLAKRKEHGSIWAMPKPALVDLVVKHLGWPRDKAADETVGQLRLHLKEFNQMVKAGKALLPKRLTRSTLAELRSE